MPRCRRRPRKSSVISAASSPPNRPAKRKQCTNRQMEEAMETARSGRMSTNQAALQHGVPTLKDRLSGRVKHGKKPGPRSYLDPDEERELTEHLVTAAKAGYGKTRREVEHIAEAVAREKKVLKKKKISNGCSWREILSYVSSKAILQPMLG